MRIGEDAIGMVATVTGCLAVSALVLFIDMSLIAGDAVAALHVVPIMLARLSGRKAVLVTVGVVSVLLTIAAGAAVPDPGDGSHLIDRAIVITVLLITAGIAYRMMHVRHEIIRLENIRQNSENVARRASNSLRDALLNQRQAEERRQDAEQRYLAIFNQTFQLVAFLSTSGVVLEANGTFLSASGLERESVIGREIWSLAVCAGNESACARLKEGVAIAARGSFYRSELALGPGEQKSRKILDFSIKPIRDRNGEVEILILEARDITEQKLQTAALARQERLKVIGQFASGIAHDVNNTLTAISGNLELAARRLADESKEKDRIERALDAVFYGKSLTQQLLAFAKRQTLAPSALDIEHLMSETTELLEHTLPDNISLTIDVGHDVWRCWADESHAQTALMNLILNARDAMPEGGRIVLGASNVVLEEDRCGPEMMPGPYICISVRDDGEGIEPEIQDRVMEPFFTTKGQDKGTGLGLSMVWGFVRQSGGDLEIESEPGKGTLARIYLPRAQEDDGDARESEEREISHPTPARILVVEDQSAVSDIATAMLRELGYSVEEAHDGTEAIRILREDDGFDLVLSDVMLPGGTGIQDVVAVARKVCPDMRFVFCSGDPPAARRMLGDALHQSEGIVAKPYRLRELDDVVARALERG